MRPRLLDSRLLFILALCLAASTGCASKVVTRVNAEKGVTSEGVSYFLPTNSVRIVFTNTTIASEVKKANAALKKAKKNVKTATRLLAAAEKKLAARDPKKKQDPVQLKNAKNAKKKLEGVKALLTKAETAVGKAEDKKAQILVEVLPPVADTSQVYVAKLSHNAFYRDTLTLTTSADGLLTKVIYKGEDKTGGIVHDLVGTAVEAAKLYARFQVLPIPGDGDALYVAEEGERRCRAKPLKTDKEYAWEFTIDPSNPDELARVNAQLAYVPMPYLVSIRAPETLFSEPARDAEDFSGIYYRRPLPYTIEVYEDPNTKLRLCRKLVRETVDVDAATAAVAGAFEGWQQTKRAWAQAKRERDAARNRRSTNRQLAQLDKLEKKVTSLEKQGRNAMEAFDAADMQLQNLPTRESIEIPVAKQFMVDTAGRIPSTLSKQVVMAAGGPVTPLRLVARPLVVTDVDLTLKDGLLLESVETRPSEALGFSTILLDTVTTVGDAVGEILDNILPIQIKWTNQARDLVAAETELLRAKQTNAELQKELLEQFDPASQPVEP